MKHFWHQFHRSWIYFQIDSTNSPEVPTHIPFRECCQLDVFFVLPFEAQFQVDWIYVSKIENLKTHSTTASCPRSRLPYHKSMISKAISHRRSRSTPYEVPTFARSPLHIKSSTPTSDTNPMGVVIWNNHYFNRIDAKRFNGKHVAPQLPGASLRKPRLYILIFKSVALIQKIYIAIQIGNRNLLPVWDQIKELSALAKIILGPSLSGSWAQVPISVISSW